MGLPEAFALSVRLEDTVRREDMEDVKMGTRKEGL